MTAILDARGIVVRFGGLTAVDQVFAIIGDIREEGVTILVVEQNVARALAIAEDAHVLERGRLVASGYAAELLRSSLVQTAYLGEEGVRSCGPA